jgi:nucleotidyltransferase substrate binding protein (TIGR01987 family)
MTDTSDVRWKQRLDNYRKAYKKLAIAAEKVSCMSNFDAEIKELANEGLFQRFEYTHELACNVMKDYETYQGYNDIRGSRDAIKKALAIGLIDNQLWLETIIDRNKTSHNYDESAANEIQHVVVEKYLPLFAGILNMMEKIETEEG